jgi:hypothetical protein
VGRTSVELLLEKSTPKLLLPEEIDVKGLVIQNKFEAPSKRNQIINQIVRGFTRTSRGSSQNAQTGVSIPKVTSDASMKRRIHGGVTSHFRLWQRVACVKTSAVIRLKPSICIFLNRHRSKGWKLHRARRPLSIRNQT